MAISDTGSDAGRDGYQNDSGFVGDGNAGGQPFGDRPPFDHEPQAQQPFMDEPMLENEVPAEEPPQLELGDDDSRLPWLEGDDDEFEDDSSSAGQGILLVLLGLVAIGLIVGGLFWVMRDKPRPLVADGGVIAAPKEPYKSKPENPGGEVVAGTGDTSFAVAEGQSRPPQIDSQDEAPKPGFASVDKPAPAAAASSAPAADGVGVQVGAYTSKSSAEAGWNALKSQYPALSDMKHRIVQGQADIGTVYRLQAVPGDLAAAKSLCSGMKSAGLSCQVKN